MNVLSIDPHKFEVLHPEKRSDQNRDKKKDDKPVDEVTQAVATHGCAGSSPRRAAPEYRR